MHNQDTNQELRLILTNPENELFLKNITYDSYVINDSITIIIFISKTKLEVFYIENYILKFPMTIMSFKIDNFINTNIVFIDNDKFHLIDSNEKYIIDLNTELWDLYNINELVLEELNRKKQKIIDFSKEKQNRLAKQKMKKFMDKLKEKYLFIYK